MTRRERERIKHLSLYLHLSIKQTKNCMEIAIQKILDETTSAYVMNVYMHLKRCA